MNATSNIADLNDILPLYQQLSGKSDQEVLSRSLGKLTFNLKTGLRRVVPPKGSIREALIARLKSGRGIKIRQSVRDEIEARRANPKSRVRKDSGGNPLSVQQEMIRREIAVRESGRGVLSISSRYPSLIQGGEKALSRYSQILSESAIKATESQKVASVTWSGISKQSARVVKGLQGSKAEDALASAIAATKADTLVYIQRKQEQKVRAAVKKMHK